MLKYPRHSSSNQIRIPIIGFGPAGIAAAIQLKRSGLEPLIFESNRTGGLLFNANLIENYPGFPEGISGPNLVEILINQAVKFDLEIIREKVRRVDCIDGKYCVETKDKYGPFTKVIIASGTEPVQYPELDSFEIDPERIHYDLRKLYQIKGSKIAIVGGGDAAFDYALNLSRHNNVSILCRSDKTNCLPLLFERARESDRIEIMLKTKPTDIRMNGDRLNMSTDSGSFTSDHVIFAIGRTPCLGFLSDELSNGTAGDGITLIGDVSNGSFRQVSIAVGDGVRAAMEISKEMNV